MSLMFFILVPVAFTQTDGFSLNAVLQRAGAAYENSDYAAAASLYETAISAGVNEGAVYFNLGNAYYQMGDLGRALLNFRRAQEFMPRDADIDLNLARVRTQRLDLQRDEVDFLNSLAALTIGLLWVGELSWLVFIFWTVWFVLLLVGVLRSNWRDTLRPAVLAVGIVLLIGMILLGSRLYVTTRRPAAVVIDETTQVMSGPGENYLALFELHAAAEIRLLETRDGWARFTLPDGRQGWIDGRAIMPVLRE